MTPTNDMPANDKNLDPEISSLVDKHFKELLWTGDDMSADTELRERITNEINDVRSQGGDYGLQADAIANRIMQLIKQRDAAIRKEQVQKSFLEYSLFTDVDESLLIQIRDKELAELSTQTDQKEKAE